MNIYKIALTGGPCAGKTTILNHLTNQLKKEGYYVITIPETATYLIKSNTPPLEDPKHAVYFQNIVLKLQLAKEEAAEYYCKNTLKTNPEHFNDKKGIIILCDRGIMDNRAYLNQEEYDNMLKNHNLNELELLYSYDLAINLISLATTNPELYQLDGVRYEPVEKAAERDKITSSAWLLHPNLKMIKPQNTIEEKMELVEDIVNLYLNNQEEEYNSYIDLKDYKVEVPDLDSNNSKASIKTYYEIMYPNNKKSTLIEIKYKNNTIYKTEDKYLTKEEYLNLLKFNLLKKIKEEVIIDFVLEGNHYRNIRSYGISNLYAINDNINKISHTKILKKTRRK